MPPRRRREAREPDDEAAGGAEVGAEAREDGRVASFAPSSGQLAVHKKKVEEVRAWLEGARGGGTRVAVLTGPAGCGKSATLRALAAEAGLCIAEYTPAAPTLWEEHQRLGRAQGEAVDVDYTSKVADFERFLVQAVAFPALQLQGGSGGGGARMVIIDDLPYAHNADAEQALLKAIDGALRRANGPVAIVLSDESAPLGVMTGLETLASQRGATTIKFNPVTERALAAALEAAAPGAGRGACETIAAGAQGDLRHALLALQFHMGGAALTQPRPSEKFKPKRRKTVAASTAGCGDGPADKRRKAAAAVAGAARGDSLSIFHALGKIMYNKRAEPTEPGSRGAPLFDPEAVIDASKLEPERVMDFLQENAIDYVNADAIDDLMDLTAGLSDAADALEMAGRVEFRGASRGRRSAGAGVDVRVSTSCAASLAARATMLALRAERPKLGFRQMRPPRVISAAKEARRRSAAANLRRGALSAGDAATAREMEAYQGTIETGRAFLELMEQEICSGAAGAPGSGQHRAAAGDDPIEDSSDDGGCF